MPAFAQPCSEPEQKPTTPPTSVTSSSVSAARLRSKVSEERLRELVWVLEISISCVFTSA